MSESSGIQKLAYLGPLGTYSHQVAYQSFGPNVEYIEKECIKDVFDTISADIPIGVVPQENSIFGSVTETYDSLRLPRIGSEIFVKGELTVAVRHCLIIRRGGSIETITKILSHEQALGQCAKFIADNFPSAILQKMPSTAAAAKSLLDADHGDNSTAAICSSHCVTVFEGLEVLQENIQDLDTNVTRFYILANSLEAELPYIKVPSHLHRALIRITLAKNVADDEEESSEEFRILVPPDSLSPHRSLHLIMSTLLTTFGLPVIRIDRRPSLNPVPFDDVYFVELEELGGPHGSEKPRERAVSGASWIKRVQMGIERVAAVGGEASILGYW